MFILVIWGVFNSRRFSYSNILVFLSPYSYVSGSYLLGLHCLGHRIKYGYPKVGNATQQTLSTRPYCSIEFIESFVFWVILVTYMFFKIANLQSIQLHLCSKSVVYILRLSGQFLLLFFFSRRNFKRLKYKQKTYK